MPEDEKVIVGDDMPKEEEAQEPEVEETPEPEEAPKEEKVYAGKFKTPEDLEKSYTELEKKLGEQGSRLGETEKERGILLGQLEQLQSQNKQVAPENKDEANDLNQQLQDITNKIEEGDLSIAEGMMQTAKITAQMAQMATVNDIQQRQQQETVESSKKNFADQNPDFFDLQQSGELDAIKNELPGFHDDVSAYYAKKAMDTQTAMEQAIEAAKKEGYEAGKAEMAKLADGDKNTAKVLQSGGKSAKDIGRKTGPLKQSDLRQSGLAALERARGG